MTHFDYEKLATDLYRKRMGTTKAEQLDFRSLSTHLGISASTLCRIEQGNYRATIENLLPVVGYLGKTLNDYVVE
jgi:transcriptional regulator with XRE-family HTH domain